MKISCSVADDLLPLYLDNSCSEESKAVLEEHLKECPSCREKLSRMQSEDYVQQIQHPKSDLKLVNYAKKIKRHRIRIGILVVLSTFAAAVILSLGYLTFRDMNNQANPTIFAVEKGTYNLTADALEIAAEELEKYIFYTNYEQMTVTVQKDGTFQGTIKVWNAADSDSYILVSDVSDKAKTCTFTNLTAAAHYKITCEGLDGAIITVGEGRTVNFWSSLKSVLKEIGTK